MKNETDIEKMERLFPKTIFYWRSTLIVVMIMFGIYAINIGIYSYYNSTYAPIFKLLFGLIIGGTFIILGLKALGRFRRHLKDYNLGCILTTCRNCKKSFKHHFKETYLLRESKISQEIKEKYPVTDDAVPARRWNIKMTEFIDLPGGGYDKLCHECDEKERNIVDNYDCGGSMCKNGCKSMINYDEPCAHFKYEIKE